MESTIVIKVNYGKTLRRFNARVDEAGKLQLALSDLQNKIISLFKLSPEVDLSLTYLDEDGDSVTLADEEDLYDVMRQSLNPLRITVKIKSKKGNNPSVNSSGISSSSANLNNTFSEIFKSVPEPIGEALSKLSLDLVSKDAASSSQLPEPVQNFSKMLHSYMITASNSQSGTVSRTQSEGSESAKANVIPPPLVKNPCSAGSSCNPNADYYNEIKKRLIKQYQEAKSTGESNSKAGKPAWDNIKAVAASVLEKTDEDEFNNGGWGAYNKRNTNNSGVLNQNIVGQCPFSGIPVSNASPYTHFGPRVHPFKKSYNQGGIFHYGITCDGCDVHPISGPRFKSKVKYDYDLCSICFAEMGNEADYIRYDHPIPINKRSYHFNRVANPPPPILPQAVTNVVNPNKPKLDSRFITDVNIIDGTVITPSTHFTKIWRMRNNGNVVWPQGTQLVWIGGERLSASLPAALQIPVDGLAIENDLEVAVNFIAPELPGRYISYWRMASPSGEKFGQRIWVLIKVDESGIESAGNKNLQGLNLNLPPESEATNLVEPLVVPPPTKDSDMYNPINNNMLFPSMTEVGPTIRSPPIPTVADLLAKDDVVEQTLLKELWQMGFKQVDLNKEVLRVNDYNLEQSVDDLCAVSDWDPILEELQEMGFIDNEVNKKLLMKNNGSIKGVVMDLVTGKEV